MSTSRLPSRMAALVAGALVALAPRVTQAAESLEPRTAAYVTLVDDLHMGPVVVASPTQAELDTVLAHPALAERSLEGRVGFAEAAAVPRDDDVCVVWLALDEELWELEVAGACPTVREASLRARVMALAPDPSIYRTPAEQQARQAELRAKQRAQTRRSPMSATAKGYLGAGLGTGVALASIPWAFESAYGSEGVSLAVSAGALVILPSTGHFVMGKVG